MPINSGVHNTGDRIQTMVDKIGVPFYISDLLMQNRKVIFDMAARDANQPSEPRFAAMSQHRRDFFHHLLNKDGLQDHTTIGMGDSLGVPVIQGMQLYSGPKSRFDALLLRDGWNLGPSQSKLRGFAKYISYTIRDEVQKRVNHTSFEENVYGYSQTPYDNETNLFQKMNNVADLMRSFRVRQDATELAGNATSLGYVLNAVLLRQGLSGSEAEQENFVNILLSSNQDALADGELPAVRAEIVDGWHSDLLDPIRGAKDVTNTLDLLTPQY
jgi:hypothetical protein